jgi:hypothetical protein
MDDLVVGIIGFGIGILITLFIWFSWLEDTVKIGRFIQSGKIYEVTLLK